MHHFKALRLFVLAYCIADDGNDEAGIKNKKYFLPRGEIKNCNVLIDGRNFYDRPINDIIKQYDEVRKVSTGFGDIDKLAPVPVDLSKLSDVVKNDVVKKTVFDNLVAKVNNIDTSDSVLKTKYQTDKTELEKKIPDVTNLVEKTKLTELENKIPDVSSLVTKTALTVVENKIPVVSSLVKKKKETITQKVLKLKRNLLTIIMTNILHLQSLIFQLLMFLMQNWFKPI